MAFNAVMLRFPRIARLRRDKSPPGIDTLERVREICSRQKSASAAG